MPYRCLSQRECWLECCTRFFATPPKFQLGQQVELVWFSDEAGREYRDRGSVIRVLTNWPSYNLPGWWYVVLWNPLKSESGMTAGCVDEIHEGELR
jgi:hypothetical protein